MNLVTHIVSCQGVVQLGGLVEGSLFFNFVIFPFLIFHLGIASAILPVEEGGGGKVCFYKGTSVVPSVEFLRK